MRELMEGYFCEVDTIDKESWHEIINNFNDANIYQTWSYGEIRFGSNKISHLIIKKGKNIIAVAQATIVQMPATKIGIAYIFWGPLWKPKYTETNAEFFSQAIRALRNEYSCRRGLLLRIFPVLFTDEAEFFMPLLKDEGFTLKDEQIGNRTLLIDLTPELNTLRKNLNPKWRGHLNRAEKNQLQLIVGDDDELFSIFLELYRALLDRKKFVEQNDIHEFRSIQKDLPANYKMKIILCKYEGQFCAGGIISAMGNTGIYLFGATNDLGMKSNGTFLIHWKFIDWLRSNQYAVYDLNGINPETNPGTYNFKAGLCGKNGKDVFFLGKFEVCDNALSFLAIKYGDILLPYYKKWKLLLRKQRVDVN